MIVSQSGCIQLGNIILQQKGTSTQTLIHACKQTMHTKLMQRRTSSKSIQSQTMDAQSLHSHSYPHNHTNSHCHNHQHSHTYPHASIVRLLFMSYVGTSVHHSQDSLTKRKVTMQQHWTLWIIYRVYSFN